MSKKFSPMRFTAATEEAAVEGALQLVGAARDEISYDFISQTAKGVTIRIRPFEQAAEEAAKAPKPETNAQVDDEAETDEIEAEAPLHIDSMHDYDDSDDDSDDDFDAEESDDAQDVAGVGDLAEDEDEASETSDDELDFDADLELADDEYDADFDAEEDDQDDDEVDDDQDEEDEEREEPEIEVDAEMLERALTLAGAMLDKMGLEAQVTGGRATVPDILPLSIEGEDVGILIGKHGATLQSFQYLVNLTLNHSGETSLRVTVDAGNYRARRQESLEAVARGTASRVRRENRPIKMEPMPSNERRIVHDFLKNETGVSTQSEGREPHRCIVIAPAERDYRGAADENNRGRRGMGGYGRGGGRGGRNRR